ncbi:DEAD/DEAH box helicase family protein [Cereibacter azotoformans]|uniref:Helicase ATP-binding domain-containing protein n=1 Tax=Cereibacter sphaeroides (strain ATCC 17025 / ATH 2.4.3) TaxID=349102 RepID=A4WYE1_CERS5|nr:DEAD/DEAH box helicase family protein [Cereibacter azotoformans]ULB11865.1 DEAD/DEAH box helicase family protein [Cereibacter azotoformans]
MDSIGLSERDICSQRITPAIIQAGWDLSTQIREEVSFTKGRIIVRGKLVSRGKGKRADYILSVRPNIRLAVVEAKDNGHAVGAGIQQALEYAETLNLPFAFSSNGEGFVFHDRTGLSPTPERLLTLDEFPSPAELWQRYCEWKGLDAGASQVTLQEYHDDGSGKEPRYYQINAVNAAIEAIARGNRRVLLVMATGTGKTYTAFQIIWRYRQAFPGKRVLFLADRNVLIDQTMVNDFRPFSGKMAKLSTQAKTIERADGSTVDLPLGLDRKRRIDPSYEIYLGLYQAITGPAEEDKIFRELSRDFFDLIIIDECHRGSAAEDSAWREILDHFSGAVQIGMTATPKETEYTSNIAYFGAPAYSYTLRQGIRDGFLAPYKVIKVHIDRDVQGYRPEAGQLDRDGQEVDDRIYNIKDFDRTLVLDDRTVLVARKVTEFLKESGDWMAKTIVFCVDQEHAARMRQALINENADLVAQNSRYVMRITGNDKEGLDQLGNFIDPEVAYPVIVTTSRLLSTGVDAQTCRLIVLDREVGSMTEFKQIVGRGTRVHEDTGKFYFTLMDFRGATNHFADPAFDGEPVQIYAPTDTDPITPPEDVPPAGDEDDPIPPVPGADETVVQDPGWTDAGPRKPLRKIYVDGVGALIIAERVEYLDEHGRLITESLRDYTRKALKRRFASLDDFLKRWKTQEKKQAVVEELEAEGLPLDVIAQELGRDLDPFDLICHIAFDAKPLTRRERADGVRKRDVWGRYGDTARAVLDALLDKYADDGLLDFDDPKILKINPFSQMGTEVELIRAFGKKQDYLKAMHDLQAALYEESA